MKTTALITPDLYASFGLLTLCLNMIIWLCSCDLRFQFWEQCSSEVEISLLSWLVPLLITCRDVLFPRDAWFPHMTPIRVACAFSKDSSGLEIWCPSFLTHLGTCCRCRQFCSARKKRTARWSSLSKPCRPHYRRKRWWCTASRSRCVASSCYQTATSQSLLECNL